MEEHWNQGRHLGGRPCSHRGLVLFTGYQLLKWEQEIGRASCRERTSTSGKKTTKEQQMSHGNKPARQKKREELTCGVCRRWMRMVRELEETKAGLNMLPFALTSR